LGTGFFVLHTINSAVNRVRFVNDRISLVMRGRWSNIIVLNVHEPSQEKNDDSEEVRNNYRRFSIIFLSTM